MRLWNPSRLDPAFPPPRTSTTSATTTTTTTTNNNNTDDILLENLPRALPIQEYTDGLTHAVAAIAINDESTLLATACDKTLVLTDVVTQQTKRRLTGQHSHRINAVAMSQHAHTIATASYDATVKIWDGRSNSYQPIQTLSEAKDSVTAVHMVTNDALIRTASVDGVMRTYDLREGVIRCDDVGSPITSMALTKDSQCLAVSCLDGTIRLVEVSSGELLNTYHSYHTAGQYGLQCCVSADDATILTGSEDGMTVLYDLVQANCVQCLVMGTAPIPVNTSKNEQTSNKPTCAIAAHPLQSHVCVTANYDGSTVVWANSPDYMAWR